MAKSFGAQPPAVIMMNPMDIEQIVAAGIAAPSADNAQPWRYRHRERHTDLWIDARRAASPSNAGYVLSDLALGAVIENMCLQAGALGYAARVDYFPDHEDAPLWVARLEWSPRDDTAADPLTAVILQRHTDRRFPFKGPIADSVLLSLVAEARRYPGIDLLLLDNGERRRTALRLMRRAETLRFRHQALHEELFSHLCWEAGWRGSCNEGLPPATLAVAPPMRPLFKALRHWRLMAALNRLGMATLLGFRAAYLPALLSPQLCLLTAASKDRTGMVIAGRALQRTWLQATLAGLAVQPFAAAGLFTLGNMQLNSRFQHDIQPLRALMNALCPPQHHGVLFLRLGNPPQTPPPRGGRRPQGEFAASD